MIKKSKKYMFKDNMAIVFFTILSLFILVETMVDSSLKGELSFIVPKYIMILFILYFIVKKTFIEDIKILCSKHSLYNNILKDKSFLKLISISIIWIIFIFILINYQLGESNNLSSLIKLEDNKSGLKLNEWGDFFAGFVAPITLLWVGFGIFYQMEEFKKVVESFEKQQRILNAQATQVEMQRIYMWYDRNIKKLSDNILKIENENINNNFSLELINDDFTLPSNGDKYSKIFYNIKDIVKVNNYLIESIENKIRNQLNKDMLMSLTDLKQEYNFRFFEHTSNAEKIFKKILFCIAINDLEIKKEKPFIKYEDYKSWLTDDYKNYITNVLMNLSNIKYMDREKEVDDAFGKILDDEFLDIRKF
jgi:hypothetical protein